MSAVESYGIYGYELPTFDAGFLHYERMEDQLPLHGWNARAHRHEGLDQLIHITQGEGRMILEDQDIPFHAPVLMVVPAGVVHGFVFSRDLRAPIITIARSFLEAAVLGLDTGFAALLSQPQMIDLAPLPRRAAEVRAAFDIIAREYPQQESGRQRVLLAGLHILFTAISRAQGVGQGGEDHVLFSAFTRALERDFRQQPQVSDFAGNLGISTARLTQICRQACGRAPQEILHARLLTEAKRMLLYTQHSATAISYMLGFREPAYFNRFFKRLSGMPPGAFRASLFEGKIEHRPPDMI